MDMNVKKERLPNQCRVCECAMSNIDLPSVVDTVPLDSESSNCLKVRVDFCNSSSNMIDTPKSVSCHQWGMAELKERVVKKG